MKVLLCSLLVLFMFGCSSNTSAPQVVNCMGVWAQCLGDCGDGKGVQHFVVVKGAQNGGTACEANDGQARACTASICAPPVDPSLYAVNWNELQAKANAETNCISAHKTDGSVIKMTSTNQSCCFGPCLEVYEWADHSYHTQLPVVQALKALKSATVKKK